MIVKAAVGILGLVFVVALYYRWRLKNSGVRVTSWFRSPWKNAEVGGAGFSQHLIGWAFDVTPVNSAVHDKLREIGFGTVLRESDHIHVSVV